MKKWVVGLMLVGLFGCASAQVYVARNQGGGEITLTTRACTIRGQNFPELREAYTWSPTAPYQQACWAIVDGSVHILYLSTNDRRVYPLEMFQRKD